MTERTTGVVKASVVNTVIAVLMIIAILLTACGSEAEQEAAAQEPGTFKNGVCLSGDGKFTVSADEERWQSGKSGDAWELCLIKDSMVRISFSPADGITKEMISDFKDTFAGSYVDALREAYPDIRTTDIREISGEMAGLGMTMTDSTGNYRMNQLLYLVSDGEDGYLITATFPEDGEPDLKLKQEIMQVIESFKFI